MIRFIFETAFLFLLPTIAWCAFVVLSRREPAAPATVLAEAPLGFLMLLGIALVTATLVVFGSNSDGRPGQVYEPPVVKDGRIEPGHLK